MSSSTIKTWHSKAIHAFDNIVQYNVYAYRVKGVSLHGIFRHPKFHRFGIVANHINVVVRVFRIARERLERIKDGFLAVPDVSAFWSFG